MNHVTPREHLETLSNLGTPSSLQLSEAREEQRKRRRLALARFSPMSNWINKTPFLAERTGELETREEITRCLFLSVFFVCLKKKKTFYPLSGIREVVENGILESATLRAVLAGGYRRRTFKHSAK